VAPDMSRHKRAYQRMLIVYPPEHRRDFGEPMAQLFADRLRDEGGGARTALLWAQTLVDLGRSAFTERLETTMRSFRTDWWRILALPLSLFIAYAGVGLPFEQQTTAGPDWRTGAILYAIAAVAGLGLVLAGSIVRKKNRKFGSTMIAVGLMPGFPMTIMFWFPPVAAVGVLSIVISIVAFIDAPKSPQSPAEPTTS
jgi:hypothetical protein